MMPKRLVLVRHGDSEGNKANRLLKKGINVYSKKFVDRHSSEFRLTDLGREQATAGGIWIRGNIPQPFNVWYTSPYVRPMETASLLALPDALWYVDLDLRERDHGFDDLLDPEERKIIYARELELYQKNPLLFPTPGGGESVADVRHRCKRIFDRLRRKNADSSVIICCHGVFMWACRFDIEHITMERYLELCRSEDPRDQIHNCQVIEYTRIDPFTGVESEVYNWTRSVCPYDLSLSRNEWTPIVRKKYTNEELMAEVEKHPRVIS